MNKGQLPLLKPKRLKRLYIMYNIHHTDNDGKTLIEPEATQDTLTRYMAAYEVAI